MAGALATLALSACDGGGRGETVVAARDYHAFFLWAGVDAPEWLGLARTVYLLAGELGHRSGSAFVPLRATPHVTGPEIWATVRLERLDWGEAIRVQVLGMLARWEAAGNRVMGLQLDFDAATRGLGGYATFLGEVRRSLDRRWRLSITGLLDWSAGGDPRALARLSGVVDEVVVQTYQGRRTIPGYESYLSALRRLGMPYRIGLVEGGTWREPQGLAADPNFRGYVVFLV